MPKLTDLPESERGGSHLIPFVDFLNGVEMTMPPRRWAIEEGEDEKASRVAVPLILGWYTTPQQLWGMSVDFIHLDLKGFSPSKHCCFYWLLSRVRHLEGLSLSSFEGSFVLESPLISDYYKSFESDFQPLQDQNTLLNRGSSLSSDNGNHSRQASPDNGSASASPSSSSVSSEKRSRSLFDASRVRRPHSSASSSPGSDPHKSMLSTIVTKNARRKAATGSAVPNIPKGRRSTKKKSQISIAPSEVPNVSQNLTTEMLQQVRERSRSKNAALKRSKKRKGTSSKGATDTNKMETAPVDSDTTKKLCVEKNETGKEDASPSSSSSSSSSSN